MYIIQYTLYIIYYTIYIFISTSLKILTSDKITIAKMYSIILCQHYSHSYPNYQIITLISVFYSIIHFTIQVRKLVYIYLHCFYKFFLHYLRLVNKYNVFINLELIYNSVLIKYSKTVIFSFVYVFAYNET